MYRKDDDLFYTFDEVCNILNLKKQTVHYHIRCHHLTVHENVILINKKDVDRMLATKVDDNFYATTSKKNQND